MGKHTQPLGEDTWTIVLLVTRVASALTASSVRIYIYRLRKRLNLPSENNIISNLSVTIICVMNIIYFGVVLFSRMTLEPGDTKIAVIIIRSLVPACIVFSSNSIWNHACDLPLFRFVTKYFMTRQVRQITARDFRSQRMNTHHLTGSLNECEVTNLSKPHVNLALI